MNVCAEYSGVIIDQNVISASLDPGTDFFYQEFRLPENYLRGSKVGQERYPGLSGFQLLTEVEEGAALTATLNYTIEQHNFGDTFWEVLATGTVVGAQAEGERIWIDVILGAEIPVTESMATNVSELRIGFQVVSGISKVYYAQPNPLPGFVEALQSDGSALLSPSASFAFRVLGLVADSGTDFLGDPYRSVVVHSEADSPIEGNTGYWLSAPQPSQFAVTSHYSDLRTYPETPSYGTINEIINPSFEYDAVGQAPFGWSAIPPAYFPEDQIERVEVIKESPLTYRQTLKARLPFATYKSKAKLTVIEAEGAPAGKNVLEVFTEGARFQNREGASIGEVAVVEAKPETFSVWLRAPKEKEFKLALTFGDSIVGKAEQLVTVKPEWQRFSVTLIPVATGTTHVSVLVPTSEKLEARTFYMDGAMVNQGSTAAAYIDGDSPSCKWVNQSGRSGSYELVEPELEDNAVVIDSIIVDPLVTGVAFNVYYTNDLNGSEEPGEMTEEQWEQKIWVHVPQSYVTTVKTTYVLPEPITAKFVKIEFSHLQPRPYEPGNYQKPTGYKLFPDWVAAPFLAELTLPAFTAKRVGVVYDALELAYQPLIADLIQSPNSPELPTPASTITPPAANRVDPGTLRRIELNLDTYTKPPAARADPTTLLGVRASFNANNQPSYPVEGQPEFKGNPTIAVSGLNRQAIVLDESIPVIFFWVTCRHEYKEANAIFENDRAYFAGLKELAFLRHQFSVEADNTLYIESGTDTTNSEVNDFNVETYPVENEGSVSGEESCWYTY